MSFSVVWVAAAEAELAEVWMRSKRRAAVTAAAFALDELLSAEGPEVGESRDGELRIAFQHPLGIHFRLEPESQTIQVGSVWEIR